MPIQLTRGIPEPLIFVNQAAPSDETWQLTRIQTLTGELVGMDANGAALVYPLTLTAVPNVAAWCSEPIQLPASGKYLAVFVSNTLTTAIEPVEVAFSSSAGGSSSTDDASVTTYATVSDMIQRFGATELAQLSDRSDAGLVTAETLTVGAAGGDLSGYSQETQDATAEALQVIQAALSDSTTEINTYLSGRYSLPLSSIPGHLKRYCCDMARYHLEGAGARAETEKRYARAVAYLRDVSRGIGNLDPNRSGTQAVADVQLLGGGNSRMFSATLLGDYTG